MSQGIKPDQTPVDPPSGVVRQRSDSGLYGPANHWREGTEIRHTDVKFLLNSGGMGDYINYTPSLIWAAKNCPWIHGQIYVSPFFMDFMSLVLKPYPKWTVHSGEQILIENGDCFIGPEVVMEGQNVTRQLANATGSHLMDLGFQYFVNKSEAPAGTLLPKLPPTRADKVHWLVRPHLGRYVVFTPGSVVPARATTGKHLNPLIDYCLALGLTPVFLGKNNFAAGMNVRFAEDIEFSKGIDLRDKTTMLQAASIMEHAVAVLGLDNGLLHLAACTDANLIFGYNITTVEQRIPRRDWGQTINLILTEEELSCVSCQAHGKLMMNHSYHNCLYGDTKCIDLLFSGGRFEWALDQLISGRNDKHAI